MVSRVRQAAHTKICIVCEAVWVDIIFGGALKLHVFALYFPLFLLLKWLFKRQDSVYGNLQCQHVSTRKSAKAKKYLVKIWRPY